MHGLTVPYEVLGVSDINGEQKIILSIIMLYSDSGFCYQTNKQIADRIGSKIPTVSYNISQLIDRGYVAVSQARPRILKPLVEERVNES